MRRTLIGLVIVAVAAGLGCRKPATIKPLKPVPPGVVLIQFTKYVKTEIELTIDGTRIPVAIAKKRGIQGGKLLWIKGLTPGKHTYFLSSATHAFGPDQGEFTVETGKGTFLLNFSQTFKAVLYGAGEPLPETKGLPGVKASLEN